MIKMLSILYLNKTIPMLNKIFTSCLKKKNVLEYLLVDTNLELFIV